jgi:hypothetical protein
MGAVLSLAFSQAEPPRPAHHPMVTSKAGSNGRVQVVRCWCCAGRPGPPRRFFRFPALGEARTPGQRQEIWAAHLAGKYPRHLRAV